MQRGRIKKWWLWGSLSLAGLLASVLVVLGCLLQPYWKRAASYDLSIVGRAPAVVMERVPSHVIDAVIASEDARFFRHGGIDFKGVCRAAWVNVRGRQGRQGASTITQQLARQTYGLLEKSMERKLVEAFLARRLEKVLTKREILARYLSIIYFGSGFYGLEAAAEGYFNKPVEALSVSEAATLVGLVKAPSLLQPFDYPERALKARNLVLGRMAAEDLLSEEEAQRLSEEPIWPSEPGLESPLSGA